MNLNLNVVLPIMISFVITVLLSPFIIKYLQKLKFGQFVRDDGPESHLSKAGTPTMGGVIIVLAFTITSLIYVKDHKEIIPVLFVTLGFGIVGFLDDYIKIVMKRSLGLKAWQKMLGQIIVTGVFVFYLMNYTDVGTDFIIPFSGGKTWEVGYWFIPIVFFVVLGTVNGANFTDGLDGLASSVTVLISVFLQ